MEIQGRDEVREAVLIAAFCAVATGLVNTALHYGCEAFEKQRKRRRKRRKKARKEAENVKVSEKTDCDRSGTVRG